MKYTQKIVVGIMVMFGCSNLVSASALEIKPGGIIFAHYQLVASQHLNDGTTAQNASAFELPRMRLNATAKYSDKISAFMQIEANLISHELGKNKGTENQVFLQSAELRLNFHKAANLLIGLVAVPWRSYEEGIWKHRFAARILEDMEGHFASTDRGIRIHGKVPFLNYDAMIGNGEGTGARGTAGNEKPADGGRLKDFTLRLAFSPLENMGDKLKGLKINALLHKGDKDENQLRDRYFAGISYESKYVNAMWTYYNGDNSKKTAPSRGEGFSLHTVVGVNRKNPEKCWAFARFDRFDPDIHKGGDFRNRYIYGVGYQLVKGVRISLDHQYLEQERRTETRQDESIFFIHTETKF